MSPTGYCRLPTSLGGLMNKLRQLAALNPGALSVLEDVVDCWIAAPRARHAVSDEGGYAR